MATSWLIMLIPYFLPIVILAILHLLDRRHDFASATVRSRRRESSDERRVA